MPSDSTLTKTNRLFEERAACEQKFWFGISRFMRESPNQRVYLAGPQHDMTVSFETRGQRTHQKNEGCFCRSLFTGGR